MKSKRKLVTRVMLFHPELRSPADLETSVNPKLDKTGKIGKQQIVEVCKDFHKIEKKVYVMHLVREIRRKFVCAMRTVCRDTVATLSRQEAVFKGRTHTTGIVKTALLRILLGIAQGRGRQ